MLGIPGSGKSFVSDWLVPHMHAVHLRSDDMRLAMYGEEKIVFHTEWKYQKQLHGGMQYAAKQILIAGYSVVYDSNHNTVKSRQQMQTVATGLGLMPILVWVKAPLEIAKQRVLQREASGGHKVFDITFVDQMAQRLQLPTEDEIHIELDGLASAEDQRRQFDMQFAALRHGEVQ